MQHNLTTSGSAGITQQSPTAPTMPPSPTPPTSSKKWLWIVIIVVAVAAAGAGGFWWWQKNKSQESVNDFSTDNTADNSQKGQEAKSGFIDFVNETYHYSLSYPNDMEISSFDDFEENTPPENATSVTLRNPKSRNTSIKIRSTSYDVPKDAKSILNSRLVSINEEDITKESEIEIDGTPAYAVSSYHVTSSLTSKIIDGKETEPREVTNHIYIDAVLAVKDGYAYTISMRQSFEGENPEINESVQAEKTAIFDGIVSSFKFLDFTFDSLNTGCLNFPLQIGNTWKYKIKGDLGGLKAESTDLYTLNGLYENEYSLRIDSIEGDSLGSYHIMRYGFDPSGNNMYLNYQKDRIEIPGSDFSTSSKNFYYDYKVFSCTQDEWEIDAKASNSKIVSDNNLINTSFAKIKGKAKVLDRKAKVSVPAGDFEAILIEYQLKPEEPGLGSFDIEIGGKAWYVPGIGKVKGEDTFPVTGTTELVEYNFKN